MRVTEAFKRHFKCESSIILDNSLTGKYELLDKYDLLEPLDEMIFEGTINLEVYLQMFQKITEGDRVKEFFAGKSIPELDMLNGDLSEIAPLIYDRINLYRVIKNTTVEEILERFVRNSNLRQVLHRHYFRTEG